MIADPEFHARGGKISEDMQPMSHQDVELLVGRLAGATDAAEAFIKNMQREQGIRVK
jgi:hypothetical protein